MSIPILLLSFFQYLFNQCLIYHILFLSVTLFVNFYNNFCLFFHYLFHQYICYHPYNFLINLVWHEYLFYKFLFYHIPFLAQRGFENVYLYCHLPKLPLSYFLMSFLPNIYFTDTFYVYLSYRVSFLPIHSLHYTPCGTWLPISSRGFSITHWHGWIVSHNLLVPFHV